MIETHEFYRIASAFSYDIETGPKIRHSRFYLNSLRRFNENNLFVNQKHALFEAFICK